jgi:hypothetical protein
MLGEAQPTAREFFQFPSDVGISRLLRPARAKRRSHPKFVCFFRHQRPFARGYKKDTSERFRFFLRSN